jgi:hypothetical protein
MGLRMVTSDWCSPTLKENEKNRKTISYRSFFLDKFNSLNLKSILSLKGKADSKRNTTDLL